MTIKIKMTPALHAALLSVHKAFGKDIKAHNLPCDPINDNKAWRASGEFRDAMDVVCVVIDSQMKNIVEQ
jgi:hypothetical protein